LNRFVTTLRERLGPQLQNVSLLYQGTPELKEVLADYGIHLSTPEVPLNTRELRARFQSLAENVFSVIAETRLFALFLDDLHEADPSLSSLGLDLYVVLLTSCLNRTLDLVSTLLNSRSRMLIFATLRSDKVDVVERFRDMLTTRTRPTWITLEPLSYQAISLLISKTLHRPKEDCAPLSKFIFEASSGNAFSARSILTTLQRQHHITFDWGHNYWV
jgi:predicted ATPase